MLLLQQTAGNAAVVRAIRAARLDPGPPPELPELSAGEIAVEPSAAADPEVLAETARQHDQIERAAAAQVAQIDATAATRRGTLGTVFASQRQQATTALHGHFSVVGASLAANSAKAVTEVANSAAGVRTDAEAAQAATDEIIDAGAAKVDGKGDAEARRAQSAGSAEVANSRPANGTSDPDVAASQQKVADAVSGKARREIQESGSRTTAAVRSHTARMKQQLIAPSRQRAGEQIRTVTTQSESAIADAGAVATDEIGQLGAQARQAATHAHKALTGAISAGSSTARNDLDTWAEQSKSRIRATAQRLASTLVAHGTALATVIGARRVGRGRRGTAGAIVGLQEAGGQVVAAIAETGQGLADGADEITQGHTQAVGAVGGQAAQGFNRAAVTAGTAMAQGASAFGLHAATVRAATSSELQQAPQRASQGLTPHIDKGVADLSTTVDEADQAQQAWTANARRQGEAGTSRVAAEAERLSRDHQQPVQRIFDAFIGSMRAWLRDKLGDIAGGIVSGLILSLPAIAIAIALLAAGPVGWGVLAALIIVGVGLGIYSRFSEYKADHGGEGPGWGAGIGLVVLGALDITGIPYIVEASVGQRAFSPKPMSTFERWERGTQGVVNLVLMVIGGGKKVIGGSEVHPAVPVDPHAPVPVDPHGPVPVDPHAPVPVDPHAPAVDPNAPVVDPNTPRPPARSCFVPGTLVATPAGLVPIESLGVGSIVNTVDPGTGVREAHRVSATMTATVDRVLDITINDVTIGVSPEHPFWDLDSGWTAAGSLREGSGLYGGDREPARVRQISRRPGDEHTVHNITVAGAHTYLVSDLRILVHNKGAAADPVGSLRGHVESLSARVRTALRSAEAQPPETAGRDATIRRLREIQKAIEQLQKESNAPEPDVEDLSDWANGIDNDLHPIEQQLPEPPQVEPTPTESLTADGAFRALQRRRLWADITRKNPGREWSAELAEDMTSNTPHEAKRKLNLTGRAPGQDPVKVEVSVIFDRNTGTFEDMHLSGGKSVRQ